MATHKNRKGLDLPIVGQPEQVVEAAGAPRHVALLGADYSGMKPTMHVQQGDAVSRGQLLFEDKKTPGVRFTAPAEGRIAEIHRGTKRAFQSLVIELSPSELQGGAGAETRYSSYSGRPPEALKPDQVRELLLESGAWTALRARPFARVADPATRPKSIVVVASDSHPLAPDMDVVLSGKESEFTAGLRALEQLTDGAVFVCVDARSQLDVASEGRIRKETFAGPHPSGTAGWHIHTLDPVDRNKLVWYIGAQDVAAIGHLFRTGFASVDRVVALAGPSVRRPRLLRSRLGVSIDQLCSGELEDGDNRQVSGSVLGGRKAQGPIVGYLGRYHQQVTALREGTEREFLGWMGPGLNRFSVVNTFVSRLIPGRKFAFTTSTNGSDRAIVPIGAYERVFPFDIPPSFLARALAVGDTERAEELGCLELDDEDVALLSFVDPGKDDFGGHLRDVLNTIWKEG